MCTEQSAMKSFTVDRMGRFIGQLRTYEDVSLKQLADGLCSLDFLCKIENGEREAGKLLVDAFFQRLGKPAEMFERILDWNEFQQWKMRQEIAAHLKNREVDLVRRGIEDYLSKTSGVLDRQFAAIMEINCLHLEGAAPEELLPRVYDALQLTQPEFFTNPLPDLLLSQNDGNLVFAALTLREQMKGAAAVHEEYRKLLDYLRQPRYDSRERLYLLPYAACRVIDYDYSAGRCSDALSLCEEVLKELTSRRRLFAYDQLLQWKQRLFDATGDPDHTPARLLEQLQLIQSKGDAVVKLLVPYKEPGHVYCLNQVIRDRRRLLGISQEDLSEGICDPTTVSRIETHGGNLHRKNRKALLQKVHMSGERYDYEVITDRYEDYLLRSELGEAYNTWDIPRVSELLDQIRKSLPNIPTNRQYIMELEASVRADLPEDHPDKISLEEYRNRCREAIGVTLPLDLERIDSWSVTILSLNELLQLISYAYCLKRQKKLSQSLSILQYVRNCLVNTKADISFYEDLYTRVEMDIASVLGDMGRYEESTARAETCLQLSLTAQNSNLIARYLFTMAWNLTKQLENWCGEERADKEDEALSLLKMAYAAAQISGRRRTQDNIFRFCQRTYGISLEI